MRSESPCRKMSYLIRVGVRARAEFRFQVTDRVSLNLIPAQVRAYLGTKLIDTHVDVCRVGIRLGMVLGLE